MVLIDTSVWINHLNKTEKTLANLLANNVNIYTHDYIIGELACGHIAKRSAFFTQLNLLPKARIADIDHYIFFVEKEKLYATGLSFIDISLIVSAKLTNLLIWTADKKLRAYCKKLNILADFS